MIAVGSDDGSLICPERAQGGIGRDQLRWSETHEPCV